MRKIVNKYVLLEFALILSVFISVSQASSNDNSVVPEERIYNSDRRSNSYSLNSELAQSDLRIGMTKIEVYEIKGAPYRMNRVDGGNNREQWVYRCMNAEGFNEDCLYLYFENDKLVNIDDL